VANFKLNKKRFFSSLNNLFFYGLAYNITNMAGNEFLNFFLLGLSEIPSNLFGWWASLNVGRRWTQTFAFLFAGTFTLIMLFMGGRLSK